MFNSQIDNVGMELKPNSITDVQIKNVQPHLHKAACYMQPKRRVLVACEFSGVVRTEFEKAGWDAWSCDLLSTEIPGQHYEGNVTDILNYGWDLLIAHPPCTYLTNSGVCHLYTDKERWKSLIDAAVFFRTLLNADCRHIAIENPIPHKYAQTIIGKNIRRLYNLICLVMLKQKQLVCG